MTSRCRSTVIGPSSRKQLKKTSPFATLLLDVSSALTEEDVSKLKLALQLDKLISRWKLCKMKHAADVLAILELDGYLSKTDTHFLEQLLVKIGRKDLERLIFKYNRIQEQQSEPQTVPDRDQTLPKVIEHDDRQPFFTQLRQQSSHTSDLRPLMSSHTEVKVVSDATQSMNDTGAVSNTHLKELHLSSSSGFISSMINAQSPRPGPDGSSMISSPPFAGTARRPLHDMQNSAPVIAAQPSCTKAQQLQKTGSTSTTGMSLKAVNEFPNTWPHSMALSSNRPINAAFSNAGLSSSTGLPPDSSQHRAPNQVSPAGSPPNSSQSSQMSVDMASQKSSSQMSVSDDEKLAVYMEKVWPHECDDANMNWIGAE